MALKLLCAVQKGDVQGVKTVFETGAVNTDNIDLVAYCDILHQAVKLGQYECLDVLLTSEVHEITEYQESLAIKGKPTLFGDACVRYYNKLVIQVLVDRGLTSISNEDLNELLKVIFDIVGVDSIRQDRQVQENFALNTAETWNETLGTSKEHENFEKHDEMANQSDETKKWNPVKEKDGGINVEGTSCTDRETQSLVKLQFILTTCKSRSLHRDILCLFRKEQVDALRCISSTKWLFCYITYGAVEPKTRPMMALQQMQTGDFDTAVVTINSMIEREELDNKVEIHHPLIGIKSLTTLLTSAVSDNSIAVVELLISKGADVNIFCSRLEQFDTNAAPNLSYFTPFELAVEKNFTKLCQILADSGVNMYFQSTGPAGMVLKNAIKNGNIDIMKLLLMNRRFPSEELLQTLDDLPYLLSDVSKHSLIIHYLEHCVRFGLMTKANIAFKAMEEDHWDVAVDMVEEMSEADVNAEILDHSNATAVNWYLLTFAVKENKEDFVQLLMEKGVEINTVCRADSPLDTAGVKSPLSIAVENNNIKMCRILLEKGAKHKTGSPYLFGTVLHDGIAPSWPSVFLSRNLEIFKLLSQHTEDPGEIFTEYVAYCIHPNSGDLFKLPHVFTLDVLKIIFGNNLQRSITKKSWYELIVEASLCKDQCGIRLEKQNIIKLLINFFPTPPQTFVRLITVFREYNDRALELDRDGELTWDVYDWLYKYSKQFPTLQRLSRYVIRKNCRSCSDEAVHCLRLPSILEKYVQHPVKVDENSLLLDCESNCMCYLEDDP